MLRQYVAKHRSGKEFAEMLSITGTCFYEYRHAHPHAKLYDTIRGDRDHEHDRDATRLILMCYVLGVSSRPRGEIGPRAELLPLTAASTTLRLVTAAGAARDGRSVSVYI